jgi:hypothetical protein
VGLLGVYAANEDILMMKKELTIISDKSLLAERKLMQILLCVIVTCYSQVPHQCPMVS